MAAASSLVAAVVSGVFAVQLLRRWHRRGRTRATLYWGMALAMFSLASAMLLVGVLAGWAGWSFRLFYLLGAVVNVPWLALGSIEVNAPRRPVTAVTGIAAIVTGLTALVGAAGDQPALWWPAFVLGLVLGVPLVVLRGRRAARVAFAVIVVFTAIAAVQVLTAPFVAAVAGETLPEGRDVFPVAVRGLAVAGNAVGAVVVIVSALASSAHLVWRRPEPEARQVFQERRRAPVEATARWLFSGRRGARGTSHVVRGNLLIALGVVLASMGGALSFLGDTTGHAVGLAVGVVVMYLGFVRTTRPVEDRPR